MTTAAGQAPAPAHLKPFRKATHSSRAALTHWDLRGRGPYTPQPSAPPGGVPLPAPVRCLCRSDAARKHPEKWSRGHTKHTCLDLLWSTRCRKLCSITRSSPQGDTAAAVSGGRQERRRAHGDTHQAAKEPDLGCGRDGAASEGPLPRNSQSGRAVGTEAGPAAGTGSPHGE